ncbi:MAG TPA: tRNA (adenosine(37)-N6)-threonylcarbamoyltransferase complex ATPase subunit type 1 TsaE [Spirochaetia bacterium]
MNDPAILRRHSTSAEETERIGELLAAHVVERFPDGTVLLLVGPLGAGKTVLARGIGRAIGVTEPVISPTYTIISEYHSGRMPLYHIDLYRIEGRDQMENLGLEDIMRGTGLVLIEWGEKLDPFFPMDGVLRVTIEIGSDGGRDITAREVPA